MANLDMDTVYQVLNVSVVQAENQVQAALAAYNAEPTEPHLIALQLALQKWQIATSVESNVLKTLSTGIQSTIQNLR